MSFITFVQQYWLVMLFYVAIILIIYLNRKKFTFEAKIIAMYRTKLGIRWMNYLAERHPKTLQVLGYIGVGVGIMGMLLSTGFIVYYFFVTILVPNTPPAVAPVFPGFPIPGTGVVIPLAQGLLALFLAVVFHEFSHGIIARAHNIKIKTTGFVMFGPLPGAFVEPDEKILKKKPLRVKNSVFTAGPFANVILAGISVLIMAFVMNPLVGGMLEEQGITFPLVNESGPAGLAGVQENVTYSRFDNETIRSLGAFFTYIETKQVGETMRIGNENESHTVILGANPTDDAKPYLGVHVTSATTLAPGVAQWHYDLAFWFAELIFWLFVLNIGLGLVNILPIGPLDGGRVFQVTLTKYLGKKRANKIWARISYIGVFILLFLLIFPMIRGVF